MIFCFIFFVGLVTQRLDFVHGKSSFDYEKSHFFDSIVVLAGGYKGRSLAEMPQTTSLCHVLNRSQGKHLFSLTVFRQSTRLFHGIKSALA